MAWQAALGAIGSTVLGNLSSKADRTDDYKQRIKYGPQLHNVDVGNLRQTWTGAREGSGAVGPIAARGAVNAQLGAVMDRGATLQEALGAPNPGGAGGASASLGNVKSSAPAGRGSQGPGLNPTAIRVAQIQADAQKYAADAAHGAASPARTAADARASEAAANVVLRRAEVAIRGQELKILEAETIKAIAEAEIWPELQRAKMTELETRRWSTMAVQGVRELNPELIGAAVAVAVGAGLSLVVARRLITSYGARAAGSAIRGVTRRRGGMTETTRRPPQDFSLPNGAKSSDWRSAADAWADHFMKQGGR